VLHTSSPFPTDETAIAKNKPA